MGKVLCALVCLVAIFNKAQSQVDVDRLFHANPPALSPNKPVNAQRPPSFQQTEPTNTITDVFDEEFKPYRGSRNDEFDWALTKKVLDANAQHNTVLSPFLVKLLLSILAEAAEPRKIQIKENTITTINDAYRPVLETTVFSYFLHIEKIDIKKNCCENTSTHRELLSILPSIRTTDETRELYGRTFGSLLKESTDYELNLGAKLYVDKFITPQQRFASIIKSSYYSDVEAVDFSRSQEAAEIINRWCANATKNHIKNIVAPDDVARSVIMLINTIYFNGYWSKPFAENQTTTENFYVNSTSYVPVPFMTKSDNFNYAESIELNAKLLRLPYKGNKFAMYIILPNENDGLDELISRIDTSNFHRIQLLMSYEEVSVSLPKFKFTNTVKLNDILKDLGIRQMFTFQASFPQLVRGTAVQDRLQVSNVLQKTGIEVNEKGSTAYAATVASLVDRFTGNEFKADRPFLFLIEDETTGTMIFSGKVTYPE